MDQIPLVLNTELNQSVVVTFCIISLAELIQYAYQNSWRRYTASPDWEGHGVSVYRNGCYLYIICQTSCLKASLTSKPVPAEIKHKNIMQVISIPIPRFLTGGEASGSTYSVIGSCSKLLDNPASWQCWTYSSSPSSWSPPNYALSTDFYNIQSGYPLRHYVIMLHEPL